MGPSHKSFEHVKRAHRITQEVGIAYDHFYVVGGCLFPEELELIVQEKTGQPYLGKICFDPRVQERVIAGKSLLDCPNDSPRILLCKKPPRTGRIPEMTANCGKRSRRYKPSDLTGIRLCYKRILY